MKGLGICEGPKLKAMKGLGICERRYGVILSGASEGTQGWPVQLTAAMLMLDCVSFTSHSMLLVWLSRSPIQSWVSYTSRRLLKAGLEYKLCFQVTA